jgi:tartrate dehydratase alpha subunit/fumarate hydratase class I-like protein
VDGKEMLKVSAEAITALTKEGMTDIAHLLRPAHLQQLSNILKDEEASENDKVRMEVEEHSGRRSAAASLMSLVAT